jgi:carbamoyl-phosphate synthase large subunit
MYSTYEEECEAAPTDRRKVMVLGGGPNRIGQGIEFDYCCVQAALALREDGYETIMVNCNPETVSTDYDTSDRLYFEPLTLEDVLEIIAVERPDGVIVQYGGQTPLKLARALEAAGAPIIGTTPDSIDLAEDRERFQRLIDGLGLHQPPNRTARNAEEALASAANVGYPLVVRPSYVLGGRAMEIVYSEEDLLGYMRAAVAVSNESPVLLDRFLDDAVEVDVDAVSDGRLVVIGGIMEHIEQAGVHSGDSACSLPPYGLSSAVQNDLRAQTVRLARALEVVGLMNVQYAIQNGVVYVLEVNPRASRTVPFLSKALGIPFAKLAAQLMVGKTLRELGLTEEPVPRGFSVKAPVFPFDRFPGFDPVLGPEMRSTGEAFGSADRFGLAFAKAMLSAGQALPVHGTVFLSVNDRDKSETVAIAQDFARLGFKLAATRGTAERLRAAGLAVETVFKVNEGRPHVADRIRSGAIDLLVNTPLGGDSFYDEHALRRAAIARRVPILSTLSAARAAVEGIRLLRDNVLTVRALQE